MGKKWLEPWEEMPNAEILFFKEQLVKEITLSHSLFGLQQQPIGRSSANDDILISVGSGKFAVIHLMWSNSGDHLWPSTEFFDSWEESKIRRCWKIILATRMSLRFASQSMGNDVRTFHLSKSDLDTFQRKFSRKTVEAKRNCTICAILVVRYIYGLIGWAKQTGVLNAGYRKGCWMF